MNFLMLMATLISTNVFAESDEWKDDLCGFVNRSETLCRQVSVSSADGKSRLVLSQMNLERPTVAVFYNATKVNALGGRLIVRTVDPEHLAENSAFLDLYNTITINIARDRPELGGIVRIAGKEHPFTVTVYEGKPVR